MFGRTWSLSALLVFLLALPTLAGDNRVIVGFKGTPDAKVVTKHGGEVKVVMKGLSAISANLPAGKIASLRAEAGVAYVEEDAVVEATKKPSSPPGKDKPGGEDPPDEPSEATPWGVTRVWNSGQPSVTGSGVKVAVIDTGIDLDHPDLNANVAGNVNFVNTKKSGDDDNGHGSHVAGTIACVDNTIGYIGVAPDASLYAVKVLDRKGSGWTSDVAAGVDWAVDNGMHIANMSLSSPYSSSTMSTACSNAESAGVLLVAAAGNDGDGSTATSEVAYPAAYYTVVSVGATNSSDALASFSNTHSTVELSGPGVSVPSAYKNGGYRTDSGTSMASPHVAGVAALIWEELASPSNSSVRSALINRAYDLGPNNRDNGFGYGLVQY